LPHVGVAFGTKYLAFIDPENVGVLDDKITRHLQQGSYQNLIDEDVLSGLIKRPYETEQQEADRFHAFCVAINHIKGYLNHGNAAWRDSSGASLNRFRAIDVERALFSLAKSKDTRRKKD